MEIKLKPGEAEKLRAAHHKGNTASAVRAAINESLERVHLRAQYPRPHVPNAATARAQMRIEPRLRYRNDLKRRGLSPGEREILAGFLHDIREEADLVELYGRYLRG